MSFKNITIVDLSGHRGIGFQLYDRTASNQGGSLRLLNTAEESRMLHGRELDANGNYTNSQGGGPRARNAGISETWRCPVRSMLV